VSFPPKLLWTCLKYQTPKSFPTKASLNMFKISNAKIRHHSLLSKLWPNVMQFALCKNSFPHISTPLVKLMCTCGHRKSTYQDTQKYGYSQWAME
jgi:hypothetical protein